MSGPLVTFRVIGDPKPQGSKSAFTAKHTGKVMTKESGGVGFAAWRNLVSEAAMRSREQHEAAQEGKAIDGATFILDSTPFTCPLHLVARFRFKMPPSRSKAIRQLGWRWKTEAPDQSKLIRLIEDSMIAAGLIKDDSLIVQHTASKIEVLDDWTGVEIELHLADNERPT